MVVPDLGLRRGGHVRRDDERGAHDELDHLGSTFIAEKLAHDLHRYLTSLQEKFERPGTITKRRAPDQWESNQSSH